MTQLQMLMALNTVINHGKLVKPYLVDHIEDNDGNVIHQNAPIVLEKVFSEEVSKLNRHYMEAVVTKGTGQGAQILGYNIGGKTGTAKNQVIKVMKKENISVHFLHFFL